MPLSTEAIISLISLCLSLFASLIEIWQNQKLVAVQQREAMLITLREFTLSFVVSRANTYARRC